MKKRFGGIILTIILILGVFPSNIIGKDIDEEPVEDPERAKVIGTRPARGERYFDPERLRRKFSDPEEEGYYIEIVFENLEEGLKLVNELKMPTDISVRIEGEDGNSLEDQNKKLRFSKSSDEIKVFIPLRDRPVDGQKYKVNIPKDVLIEYEDPKKIGKTEAYEFTFETNHMPKVDRLYEGALPESYDYNYPIVIDGSSFHRNTRVQFKSMDGRLYGADDVIIRNDYKTLYIYLPRHRRLPIGVYDIIVSNGYNYEVEIEHGVLSIVEEGDYIPEEEIKIKDENSLGTIKNLENRSKTTLELKKDNRKKHRLEINLDELMGSETWTRTIEYPANFGDSIGQLVLKSKWTSGNIRGLKLKPETKEKQIKLSFGRAEPGAAEIVKNQLVNNNVKSDFIELSGANFDFHNITLEIPYFESDGSRLKLLRYDEETRKIEEIPFTTDFVNRKLVGTSEKSGIFVIVD